MISALLQYLNKFIPILFERISRYTNKIVKDPVTASVHNIVYSPYWLFKTIHSFLTSEFRTDEHCDNGSNEQSER
jgi:hypothetical protein